MGYEARMDAASDYLAEHYYDCIEYDDIVRFIESMGTGVDSINQLWELRDMLIEKCNKLKEEAMKNG